MTNFYKLFSLLVIMFLSGAIMAQTPVMTFDFSDGEDHSIGSV